MSDGPDGNIVKQQTFSDFNVARRQLDKWRMVEAATEIYAGNHPIDREAQARAARLKTFNDNYEEKKLHPLQDRFVDRNSGREIGQHLRGERFSNNPNDCVDIEEVRKAVLDSRDDKLRVFNSEKGLMHRPVGDDHPHLVTQKEVDHARHWMQKDQALDRAQEAVLKARAEREAAGPTQPKQNVEVGSR